MKVFQTKGDAKTLDWKIFYNLAVCGLLFESQFCDFYVGESGLYAVSKADICLF